MPHTTIDERLLKHINDNVAQGLNSPEATQRQAAARMAWQLAALHDQPDITASAEVARTRQLALSAITKAEIRPDLTPADRLPDLMTTEEARQRYRDFTSGKLSLSPQESLALRNRILLESESQHDLMPVLSPEETGWLAQLAEQQQRTLSHLAIAVAGPGGFLGALASSRHASPEVINNMTAVGLGLSGGIGGKTSAARTGSQSARTAEASHAATWKTIGEGHVPPARTLRDLSNRPVFDIHRWGSGYDFAYRPEGALQHFMFGGVDQHGVMRFAIRAGESRQQYGSGAEMVMTMTNALQALHIPIRQIECVWECAGAMTSNHRQFWANMDNGMSPEQAARETFTGRMAGELNLREVSFSAESMSAIASGNRAVNIEPGFRGQYLGLGGQWQNYGDSWVDAMGRRGHSVVKEAPPISHEITQDPGASR